MTLWYVDVNQVVMTRVDAMFGAYGDLPLALVQFEDAYVLVDTVNGTLAGPFEPTSPFDATSLLANHPDTYEPDSHILYVDDKGCRMISPDFTPRTSRGRLPVGWDSEEGMRQIGGVRAGRSASDHSAHAASATPTSASSTTAFPTRRRRMTDA